MHCWLMECIQLNDAKKNVKTLAVAWSWFDNAPCSHMCMYSKGHGSHHYSAIQPAPNGVQVELLTS